MATTPPKVPPRFVPTLTEVVRDSIPAQQSPPPVAQSGASGLTSSRVTPPRTPAQPALAPPVRTMHPTASLVPRPAVAQASAPPAHAPNLSAAVAPAVATRASNSQVRALPEGAEEYMVHRVMQRVDVVLDKRLREAIAVVVQEQTRSVLPRLREEIESVVRQAVYEAVADELASTDTDPAQP